MKIAGEQNQELAQHELEELTKIMNIRYAPYLRSRFFEISTGKAPGFSLVTMTLRNADESFYYPVEGRLDCDAQDLSHRESCLFLLDYIELYFNEFLKDGEDTFIPIDWSPFQCEGVSFELKGQVLNRKYSKMADRLLGEELTNESAMHECRGSKPDLITP